MTLCIMVVDDQRATRLGITLMVHKAPDLRVIAEAGTGADAITELRRRRDQQEGLPDVVLMDIRMPVMNGIDATALINKEFPSCRVLALTTFDQDDYAFAMLSVGASGFLLKDLRAAQLHDALRAVHAGDAILTPRITKELLRSTPALAPPRHTASQHRLDRLTRREQEVAVLVARGLNNQEIAQKLSIQPESVKKSVTRILGKLELRDRVHITIALRDARETELSDGSAL